MASLALRFKIPSVCTQESSLYAVILALVAMKCKPSQFLVLTWFLNWYACRYEKAFVCSVTFLNTVQFEFYFELWSRGMVMVVCLMDIANL
jgi:hypothetical protein